MFRSIQHFVYWVGHKNLLDSHIWFDLGWVSTEGEGQIQPWPTPERFEPRKRTTRHTRDGTRRWRRWILDLDICKNPNRRRKKMVKIFDIFGFFEIESCEISVSANLHMAWRTEGVWLFFVALSHSRNNSKTRKPKIRPSLEVSMNPKIRPLSLNSNPFVGKSGAYHWGKGGVDPPRPSG